MNTIQKTEAILQATVEALRELGFGGFSLNLNFYNHYETSVACEVATEMIESEEYRSMPRKDGSGYIKREYGSTGQGQWEVTAFVPPASLVYNKKVEPVVKADKGHKAKLIEIVEDE